MSIGQDGDLFEEWLELRNGCLCCSVKAGGDVDLVEKLPRKDGSGVREPRHQIPKALFEESLFVFGGFLCVRTMQKPILLSKPRVYNECQRKHIRAHIRVELCLCACTFI